MLICTNAKTYTAGNKDYIVKKKYDMRIVDMLWEFYLYQLLNRQHPIPPTHKEMEHLATQNVTFWFSESMSLKNVVYVLSFFSICDHNDKHFYFLSNT